MRGRFIALCMILVVLAFLGTASAALAHGGEAKYDESEVIGPRNWNELWHSWAFEPLVVIPLVLTGWLYARGIRRIWTEAGWGHGVTCCEAASFTGGWLALVVALVSPLHLWGNMLFSVHMSQHEILMLVAAPLLVLGKPLIASLKALPSSWVQQLLLWSRPGWVRAGWHVVINPFVAWLIHAVVLWIWHLPVLFHAALESELIHALQHISFLLSALLFWWAVLEGPERVLGYGAAVLYMFTTALHSGFLGALITLAATLWYPDYLKRTRVWGLSPIEDQQLGGLIMWIPACSVYIVAGVALFAGWLRSSEERLRRREAGALLQGASR